MDRNPAIGDLRPFVKRQLKAETDIAQFMQHTVIRAISRMLCNHIAILYRTHPVTIQIDKGDPKAREQHHLALALTSGLQGGEGAIHPASRHGDVTIHDPVAVAVAPDAQL